MTRTYSDLASPNAQFLLDKLVDRTSTPAVYKETLLNLGMSLGDRVLADMDDKEGDVYLACTVEDADFLAKGMLLRLERQFERVAFACFWNQRFSPFEIEDLKVAPIIKRYQEPSNRTIKYLIVVKSIISGACVVRTNLMNLVERLEPEKIFIVAPVMFSQAETTLRSSFDREIYEKFQFFYLAKDDQRTAEGEVIPGIGGMVYDRLGFNGQDAKNEYIPEIVKTRRSKLIKA